MICTDVNYLNAIYLKAGRPGLPVNTDLLHWVPYKKGKEIVRVDKIDKWNQKYIYIYIYIYYVTQKCIVIFYY